MRGDSGEKGEAERGEKGACGSRVSWCIAITSAIAIYTRHESYHNLITWQQTLTTTLTSSPLHDRRIVFPPPLHRVSPPCHTPRASSSDGSRRAKPCTSERRVIGRHSTASPSTPTPFRRAYSAAPTSPSGDACGGATRTWPRPRWGRGTAERCRTF